MGAGVERFVAAQLMNVANGLVVWFVIRVLEKYLELRRRLKACLKEKN